MDSLPGVVAHVADAWSRRDTPNIVLVHYDDLAADLDREMRALARRLRISVADDVWPRLVDAAGFARMRANADALAPDAAGVLRDRARFFRRGRSGAGRETLSEAEFDRYRARLAELGPPEVIGVAPSGGARGQRRLSSRRSRR